MTAPIDLTRIEDLLKDPSRGEDGSAADVQLLAGIPDLVRYIRELEDGRCVPPDDEQILTWMSWLIYKLKSRWDGVVAICKRLHIQVDALQALADTWGGTDATYRNDEVELTIRRISKEEP